MTKTTLATIKSFIRREYKNNNLYVKQLSDFDSMVDCVTEIKDEFRKVAGIDETNKNSLGIPGAWFIGGSRNSFDDYADDGYIGYKVYNSCGSFIIAMKRLY